MPLVDHLRAMRAFLAVATHGSTVRAAQAMHLSQPAVARAVGAFERACGVALFERSSRGLVPTPLGRRLAARAGHVFDQLAAGVRDAAAATPAAARATPSPPERFCAAASAGQLRALAAIASAGSEAAAAAVLEVTQPAVHQALQALERLAGVRLFHRLATGTRLTPAGEALLRRVKLALAEIEAMTGDLGAGSGRLVVGVLPLSVAIFLPAAVDALLARHPGLAVEIVDGPYERLADQLLGADIDVIAGALRTDAPTDELRLDVLFDDELVVLARAGHPCLARGDLALVDLLQWDWVAPLADTPAERALDRAFAACDAPPPSRRLRAGSPASTLALVARSARLALASRGEAEAAARDGGALRIVPVPLPGTAHPIGLATRAVGLPSRELAAFVEACRVAARVD